MQARHASLDEGHGAIGQHLQHGAQALGAQRRAALQRLLQQRLERRVL